jgi:hypothetical protein
LRNVSRSLCGKAQKQPKFSTFFGNALESVEFKFVGIFIFDFFNSEGLVCFVEEENQGIFCKKFFAAFVCLAAFGVLSDLGEASSGRASQAVPLCFALLWCLLPW